MVVLVLGEQRARTSLDFTVPIRIKRIAEFDCPPVEPASGRAEGFGQHCWEKKVRSVAPFTRLHW